MFSHYYDLKDENKLPPRTRFIDPMDNAVFVTDQNETLDNFINRIESSRAEKDLPKIFPKDLRTLVVLSLAEFCSPKLLEIFFVRKSLVPDMAHMVNLAKTIVAEHSSQNQTSYLCRQDRAAKCHACSLHRTRGGFSAAMASVIARLASLQDLAQSQSEKKLGTCGMCGCSLQAKIKFSILGVLAGVVPSDLHKLFAAYGKDAFSRCWILNESLQRGDTKKLLETKLHAAGPSAKHSLHLYLKNKKK